MDVLTDWDSGFVRKVRTGGARGWAGGLQRTPNRKRGHRTGGRRVRRTLDGSDGMLDGMMGCWEVSSEMMVGLCAVFSFGGEL